MSSFLDSPDALSYALQTCRETSAYFTLLYSVSESSETSVGIVTWYKISLTGDILKIFVSNIIQDRRRV